MLPRLTVDHGRCVPTILSVVLLSTCKSFGTAYGSSDYRNCMLEQQRRRDSQHLESLERTRMTMEIARDAQVMADRARWGPL